MKSAQTATSKWYSMSSTDPTNKGLCYKTKELADAHTEMMNKLRLEYPAGKWNEDFWKGPPGEWRTYQ